MEKERTVDNGEENGEKQCQVSRRRRRRRVTGETERKRGGRRGIIRNVKDRKRCEGETQQSEKKGERKGGL